MPLSSESLKYLSHISIKFIALKFLGIRMASGKCIIDSHDISSPKPFGKLETSIDFFSILLDTSNLVLFQHLYFLQYSPIQPSRKNEQLKITKKTNTTNHPSVDNQQVPSKLDQETSNQTQPRWMALWSEEARWLPLVFKRHPCLHVGILGGRC